MLATNLARSVVPKLTALRRDLRAYPRYHNFERAHTGLRNRGQTPLLSSVVLGRTATRRVRQLPLAGRDSQRLRVLLLAGREPLLIWVAPEGCGLHTPWKERLYDVLGEIERLGNLAVAAAG